MQLGVQLCFKTGLMTRTADREQSQLGACELRVYQKLLSASTTSLGLYGPWQISLMKSKADDELCSVAEMLLLPMVQAGNDQVLPLRSGSCIQVDQRVSCRVLETNCNACLTSSG